MAADVLRQKDAVLQTIPSAASVLAAIRQMNAHHIGALLVTEDGKLAGIFTERDVLTRVAAEEKDLRRTTVAEVMSPDVLCCTPETELDDISQLMKQRRIRHIPVRRSSGELMGIISIGDINAHYVSQQQATIENLSDYICGRG